MDETESLSHASKCSYDDTMSTLSKKWGGGDEIGLRTAIFVSFMKVETFKNGLKMVHKEEVSDRDSI